MLNVFTNIQNITSHNTSNHFYFTSGTTYVASKISR
jgi:hypothetical protein